MGVIRYRWRAAADYTPGRRGAKVRNIILHQTDGHLAGDLEWLTKRARRRRDKASVQWLVARDGRIWHLVQDCDTAYHAGTVVRTEYDNRHTIGIEQEHLGAQDWPEAQVLAVAHLVAYQRQRFGPEVGVISHRQAAPRRKVDPVDYPWDELSRAVGMLAHEHWEAVRMD